MKHLTAIAAIALSIAASAYGQVGLGLKAGTLGAGVDLSVPVSADRFNVRLNGNYFSYSRSDEFSDINTDAKLKLNTIGLLADWYPFKGSFRVTAGGYYNGNKIDVTGKPHGNGTYTFNNVSYTAQQVGTLTGKAELGSSVAPYVGVGFGNSCGQSKRWSFIADFGVMFTGSPELTLNAYGPVASDATFRANLEAERRKAQDDVNTVSVYPVIALGVSYRF